MAWLRVIDGPDKGRVFRVAEETATVGRAPTSAIHLSDGKVSRRHMLIRWSGGSHVVLDLSSANGVYINGRPVTEAELSAGDGVQIGHTQLVYEVTAKSGATGIDPKAVEEIMGPPIDDAPALPEASFARPTERLGPSLRVPTVKETDSSTAASVVGRIAGELAAEDSLEAIQARICDGLLEELDASRVAVLRLDGDRLRASLVRQAPGVEGLSPTPALLRAAIVAAVRRRNSYFLNTDEPLPPAGGVPGAARFPVICAPLLAKTKILGVLYADSVLDKSRRFTTSNLMFAAALANQLAIAIDRREA